MKDSVAKLVLRVIVWAIYGALGIAIIWGIVALVRMNGPVFFLQSVVDGLRLGFVYALIALGYTMVYGIVRLINFAHADVFMVGAFASFYAISEYQWGFVPAILLAMIVCTILNVVIERVAYKPLRNAPRIAALITAIGVSFFLEYFTALKFVFGADYITYQRPFEVVIWNVGGVLHQQHHGDHRRPHDPAARWSCSTSSTEPRSARPCAPRPLTSPRPA